MTQLDAKPKTLLAIEQFVSSRTGLKFTGNRLDHLHRKVCELQADANCDLPSYFQQIKSSKRAFDALIERLTVGETFFFRHAHQFQLLRDEIIPEIRARMGGSHTIDCWNAACATGEEAYSLAITMHECGELHSTRLLATDISNGAIEQAKTAVYRSWSLRDQGPDIRGYIEQDDINFKVDKRLVASVIFRQHNLITDAFRFSENEFRPFDIVMCRNVMIYFDRRHLEPLTQKLFDCLRPGGWLMLGAADPLINEFAPFEMRIGRDGVLYRKPLEESEAVVGTDTKTVHGTSTIAIATGDAQIGSPATVSDATAEVSSIVSTERKLADAENAFQRGEYQRAIELLTSRGDESSCCLLVKALSGINQQHGLRICAEMAEENPTWVELNYLFALMLMEHDDFQRAADAARRVLFLDSSLVVVHFTMGTIYQNLGETDLAKRAYRNVIEQCQQLSPQSRIRFAEGETQEHLVWAAEHQLQLLQSDRESTS